ncbi:MAG: hypothetical protein KAU50_04385 [Candidatus Marinimicrobia bacterium]|nr:hypothetical protein [Candidatus Neomarinimicrobiota bacterium]
MFALGQLMVMAGSIYTGVTTLNAANKQATALEEQGALVLNEALRDASITREEGRNFAANQSLQYIGAGVELVGSALITMAQTRKYAETEAAAMISKGRAGAAFARKQAGIKRAGGRAALIGGVVTGVGTALIPAKA